MPVLFIADSSGGYRRSRGRGPRNGGGCRWSGLCYPPGRWSGGATPRFRSPNSSPPPGIHSLRNSPPRASFRPAPESVRHTAAPGAGDSPPRAAGTGSDNTSGSARHSSPPCRFPSCRHRKTDAQQFRFTTIPQIKGNEKEMKGKWQIYQTKHD